MSIRNVIPKPTPVSLGGRRYLASELRLDDVSTLQAFIDVRFQSPYDAAGGMIAAGSAERSLEWRRLLAATVEAQAAWPKEPGSPEADEVLATREGRTFLIGLVLRREHPTLTGGDHGRIYAETTAAQFGMLSRIAWGNEPLRDLMALIDGPDEVGGNGPDWPKLWVEYGRAFHDVSFRELTVTQFIVWRRGGGYNGRVDGNNPRWGEIADRRQAFFASVEVSTNEPENVHVRD